MAKTCSRPGCERGCYGLFCLAHKPRKAITTKKRPRQQSDKEKEYQLWKEETARPFVIERDGNHCACCGRLAHEGEKLDLDHILGKGSHPSLKRDLSNFELLCRFPCHRNKTDELPCHVII